MFKVQHIALTAALYGLHAQTASAQTTGCFPGWVSDRPYSADSRVSARITSTTAIVTTPCTVDSSGCDTDGFMRTGGVTTTTTHNFRCTGAPAFCSQRDPAGQFGSTVWMQESATCSGTVSATETIPDAWAGGGCPTAFMSGTDYDPESIVTVDMGTFSMVYQCTSAPNNLFCGQSGYEPGTSQYWSVAWTELGSCMGMLSPTASPIFDEIDFLSNPSGCPRDFSNPSASYEAGDLVSVTVSTSPERKVVYKCRPWPNSGYCNQVGGSLDPGQEYGFLGWALQGACTGMLAPTGAPTPYVNTDCTYIRCTTATRCTPGGATANGISGSTACSCGSGATRNSSCKQVTCTDTNVNVYSSSTAYAVGDISRRGRQKFTCKVPGWCNQSAYQPRIEPGFWSQAWTMSGNCPALNPPVLTAGVQEVGSVEVAIEVGLTLDGIDVAALAATGLDAVSDLLRSVLGDLVPEGAIVRILRIGDTSFTRRLLRSLQGTGVEIICEIVTITMCSTSPCSATETDSITNAQTQELDVASSNLRAEVANGGFASAIQIEAASMGSSAFANVSVDASSLTVSAAKVTIEEAVPAPTTTSIPSVSSQPSSQPSNQPSSQPSISSQPSE